jgi:hypothetical protein
VGSGNTGTGGVAEQDRQAIGSQYRAHAPGPVIETGIRTVQRPAGQTNLRSMHLAKPLRLARQPKLIR